MTTLTLPMPIKLNEMFNNDSHTYDDGVSGASKSPDGVMASCFGQESMSQPVTRKIFFSDTPTRQLKQYGVPTMPSTSQPITRKLVFGPTPTRQLKQKVSTLRSCIKRHRVQSRQLAKNRRVNHLAMRRQRQKRVHFHSSVKTHDGMDPANSNLQTLVLDYWKDKQSLQLLVQMLDKLKTNDLNMLAEKLEDLLRRMQLSGNMSTALLPHGGGRAVKLSKSHRPHIERLLQYTTKVRDECMRRCALIDRGYDCGLVLEDVPDFDADL